MLKFWKHSFPLLKRNFSIRDNTLLAQCLKERTILRVSGNDADAYLQGMITNDMKHLQDGSASMYTMFLNSKGRVLYDSLVYNTGNENTFFIECDEDGALHLRDHLLRYKVRRKISIECLKDELDIWTIIDSKSLENVEDVSAYKTILNLVKQNLPNFIITGDPRLSCLGLRIIAPKNFSLCGEIEKKTNIKTQEENFYKLLRYKLGVGEGMQELPSEKCFPMEANGDYLHGISFHKGCYIGQELTARTYHTGTIRKRLMPLIFNEELQVNENGILIFANPSSNKSIGKLQGIEKTTGIGLLRIEEALKADELLLSDLKCKTHRPFWWPNEAPKERMKIG